jgi:methylated-DNA-protein-cysteine methyltransferase related protein
MASATYERIYAVVKKIPKGRVATYGQIAALAGLPGHARQVGYALNKTPAGRRLPWHRVLGAGGKLSLEGAGGMEQRLRLAAEGVEMTAAGTVPLARYQWQPRVAPF